MKKEKKMATAEITRKLLKNENLIQEYVDFLRLKVKKGSDGIYYCGSAPDDYDKCWSKSERFCKKNGLNLITVIEEFSHYGCESKIANFFNWENYFQPKKLRMDRESSTIEVFGSSERVHDEEEMESLSFSNPHNLPLDVRCFFCGKPLNQLKPFGGPGDPLPGDFTGQLLVKVYRRSRPRNEEGERAWSAVLQAIGDDGDHHSWFLSRYGREKGEELFEYGLGYMVEKRWECRDCVVLNEAEYFQRISQR